MKGEKAIRIRHNLPRNKKVYEVNDLMIGGLTLKIILLLRSGKKIEVFDGFVSHDWKENRNLRVTKGRLLPDNIEVSTGCYSFFSGKTKYIQYIT